MTIKRYDEDAGVMSPDAYGDYVRYDDHMEEVGKLKDIIRKVAVYRDNVCGFEVQCMICMGAPARGFKVVVHDKNCVLYEEPEV